jgi:RNA polymerase sigma-70 factor (ECF subfamily)
LKILPQEKDNETHILSAIHETLNGNTNSFSVIVEQYTTLFYSLAYRMLGREDEAEEAVQEIFYKVFKSIKKFSLEKRFFPWIYTIAVNHLRSIIKKTKYIKKVQAIYIEEESASQLHDSGHNDPSQNLIKREAKTLAEKALLNLKPEYREVFILREIECLSVKEVSVILKKPEGTIKTNLHRAKKMLIKFITERS